MRIDPRIFPFLQNRVYNGGTNHTSLGSFHLSLPPVPAQKKWLIFDMQVEGVDSSSAFSASGETDQLLSGLYMVPQGVSDSFVPNGFNQTVEGFPSSNGAIQLTDSGQEDGFNGCPVGGGFRATSSKDMVVLPENFFLVAVWASQAVGVVQYPTVNANLRVSLWMAEITNEFFASCFS